MASKESEHEQEPSSLYLYLYPLHDLRQWSVGMQQPLLASLSR